MPVHRRRLLSDFSFPEKHEKMLGFRESFNVPLILTCSITRLVYDTLLYSCVALFSQISKFFYLFSETLKGLSIWEYFRDFNRSSASRDMQYACHKSNTRADFSFLLRKQWAIKRINKRAFDLFALGSVNSRPSPTFRSSPVSILNNMLSNTRCNQKVQLGIIYFPLLVCVDGRALT